MGIFTTCKNRIRQALAGLGIRRRFCDSDQNGVKHWEVYYDNGQLCQKYTTIDEKKDGVCEEYNMDGQLINKWTYKDGDLNGVFESYYEDGQLWHRLIYKDGKKNGPMEIHDELGRLVTKGYYRDGEYDGPIETYFPDGTLKDKTVYRNGKELKGQEAIDYLRQWRIEHGLTKKKEGPDFTLLTTDQVFGDKALEILGDNKYGRVVAPTDLTVLLGGFASDFKTSEGDFTTSAWSTSYDHQCGLVYLASYEGCRTACYPTGKNLSIRPVLSPEDASKIAPTATKKGVNNVDIIEYGEYPQTVADEETAIRLEELFQADSLSETSKTYTFNTESASADKPFSPHQYTEYEYDGKKYIRILSPSRGRIPLSNGSLAHWDMPYWVQVEPIEWLKDPSGTLISKKCLISGIPFDLKKQYWGDFENTFMKYYLDTYFAKEIETSELKMDRERKATIESLKVRLAEAGDLDKARATIKPATTPERTELAARMHRSRRERDVIRAAAVQAREIGDEKLFEKIAEIAEVPMARAQVVVQKFHERQAARRAARIKKGRE